MNSAETLPLEIVSGSKVNRIGELFDRGVATIRVLAEEAARGATHQLHLARSLSYSIMVAYWDAIQLGHPEIWTLPAANFEIDESLDAGLIAEARKVGKLAAGLSPIEAAFRITSAYASLLPTDFRSDNGIFYTPPALTHRLLATSEGAGVNWSTARVLDPACGGGAFLMPVAMRMAESMTLPPAKVLESIEQRLLGFEKDPFGAWSTQVFVESVLLPLCKQAGRRLRSLVAECDSLLQFANPRKFELVIGNPPYGRVNLPPGLREKYKRALFGHANLYTFFTDLSLRLVRPGGLVALVTPTSFLAGEYFKSLRQVLTIRTTPLNFRLPGVKERCSSNRLRRSCRNRWSGNAAQKGGTPRACNGGRV